MATTTPKISLKKPTVNVETDWGSRLNETIDILDDAVLAANATGAGTVTVTDDGSGNLTVSGSASAEALIGSDGITIVSGSSTIDVGGFRAEFVSASGSLQSQITSSDTLQEAYDNGDGFITTVSGKPLVISGTVGDDDNDFLVVGSGIFTEGLTIGTGSTIIETDRITTAKAIFTEDSASAVTVGNDSSSTNRVLLVNGRMRCTRGLAIGPGTINLEGDNVSASGVVSASGCFTETIFIGPPGAITVISGSDTGGIVTATGIFDRVDVRDIVRVGDPQAGDSIFVGINNIGLPEFGQIANEDLGPGSHILEFRGPELVHIGTSGGQVTVSGEAVNLVIKDDSETAENVLDAFGITADFGDFGFGLTVSGVPVAAGNGLTDTKTFFAPTTSGAPEALNTVVIKNGLIESWTQV